MWKLVIEDDEGKRTVVHLTRDDYTIGRKEGHSIRLTERNVSRDHAKLLKRVKPEANGRAPFLLDDLSSYNGVFVNGLRLAEAQEMVHGDLIQIGDYRIIIQDDAAAEAQAPVSAPAVEPDVEDLKATVAPGRGGRRANITGQMLLARPNRLVMLIGPTPGEEYPLDKDRITIGRAEEASISVNHNSVSRMHCEVHMLSEGRFEIVDKGSSNGVRVNGADLSRGIVEAGDVIELGDVRFKFVGAGQVFIPNSSDSQQLAAISDRQAEAALASRRGGQAPAAGGSILPFVLIGLLLGGAAVGGVYLFTKAKDRRDKEIPVVMPVPDGPSTTTSASPTATTLPSGNKDEDIVNGAWRDRSGHPEEAREKANGIALDSPLRASDKFRDIENAWALDRIRRAKDQPDQAGLLLGDVVASPAVSQTNRDAAQKLLDGDAIANGKKPKPNGSHAPVDPPPTASHKATAQPTAATAPTTPRAEPDFSGSVANLVINNKYDAARSICRSKAASGHVFKASEFSACKGACKGNASAGGDVPADATCSSMVNGAKRE